MTDIDLSVDVGGLRLSNPLIAASGCYGYGVEYADAVDSLERAVELEPGDPVINDHLGDAYWRVGRQREARYQWQRALTLEPDDDLIETIKEKLRSGLAGPDRA